MQKERERMVPTKYSKEYERKNDSGEAGTNKIKKKPENIWEKNGTTIGAIQSSW